MWFIWIKSKDYILAFYIILLCILSVIASVAKQSSRKRYIFWIASAKASQ